MKKILISQYPEKKDAQDFRNHLLIYKKISILRTIKSLKGIFLIPKVVLLKINL